MRRLHQQAKQRLSVGGVTDHCVTEPELGRLAQENQRIRLK